MPPKRKTRQYRQRNKKAEANAPVDPANLADDPAGSALPRGRIIPTRSRSTTAGAATTSEISAEDGNSLNSAQEPLSHDIGPITRSHATTSILRPKNIAAASTKKQHEGTEDSGSAKRKLRLRGPARLVDQQYIGPEGLSITSVNKKNLLSTGLGELQSNSACRTGKEIGEGNGFSQLKPATEGDDREKITDASMATRNKPRSSNSAKDDVGDPHEEHNLWSNIRSNLGKLAIIQRKQITVGEKIKEAKDALDKSGRPTARQYEELDSLCREQIKLCQEEQKLLKEEPTDVIRSVEILQALRAASNDTGPTSMSRSSTVAANPTGPKDRSSSRQKSKPGSTSGSVSGTKITSAIADDVSIGSPGPSPIATAARLKGSVRSNSVVSAREIKESSVKTEDGEGPLSARMEISSNQGLAAEKAGKFEVGAEVAYKQAKPKEDGSQWIQCTILSVTERNGKKRYEVEDADTEDSEGPGVVYTASASALIAIPPKGTEMPDLPEGKAVLAQYPDTTVFYRAKVVGYDDKSGLCRLKFEEDQDREMQIDRRLVLSLDK